MTSTCMGYFFLVQVIYAYEPVPKDTWDLWILSLSILVKYFQVDALELTILCAGFFYNFFVCPIRIYYDHFVDQKTQILVSFVFNACNVDLPVEFVRYTISPIVPSENTVHAKIFKNVSVETYVHASWYGLRVRAHPKYLIFRIHTFLINFIVWK